MIYKRIKKSPSESAGKMLSRQALCMFVLTLSMVLTSGCSLFTKRNPNYKEPEISKNVITKGETSSKDKSSSATNYTGSNNTPKTGYKKVEAKETTKEEKGDSAGEEGIIDSATIESLMATQGGKYCYDTMDPAYHRLYCEILYAIKNHLSDVRVSTTNSDDLKYAFDCMYNDHPEIFWVSGFEYVRHTKGNKVVYITFGGKYIYTENEIANYKASIDLYVNKCLAGISNTASDYEKIKYVYEYVAKSTDYVVGSSDNQTILSVFLYGSSVCQGYAKATQYLLNRLGVQCTVVTGVVNTGEGHAWNLVRSGGSYYYVDTTWGDSSYMVSNDGSGNAMPEINYDYLNITTDEISKNHQFKNVVSLPMCIAYDDNYYVREGLYFNGYDSVWLTKAFARASARQDETITFKCSDINAFNDMYDELINNQKIFDYISSDGTITYVVSEERLEFTFWL